MVLTRDLPGLVVRPTSRSIDYYPPDRAGRVRVSVDAGVGWHELVLDTLSRGLGGLENLSLIPGTVGAAPVQNIGAYGVELADRLDAVEAWHRPSGELRRLDLGACRFAYRDSLFKRQPGEFVIIRVHLNLSDRLPVVTHYQALARHLAETGIHSPGYREVSDAVIAIRQAKLPDPALLGNAGSFFKNPSVSSEQADRLRREHPTLAHYAEPDGRVKLAAAWLIENLGYKGVTRGGVGVHRDQALVLVHHGGSNGSALLALADEIADAVFDHYAVRLVPEPIIL